MASSYRNRPAVGLLYNPATPQLIACAPELVEYVAVMPDRLWYDFGEGASGGRFHRVLGAIEELRGCAEGRLTAGHGIGLSLPSAVPLDRQLLDAVATMARDIGFAWYSEHLSVFVTPHGSVPNAQAGLGLPLAYDDETFALVSDKLRHVRAALGCEVIMENGSFFTPVPENEMSEPAFLNRLYAEEAGGTLLDLHNIYVNWRNGGMSPTDYLNELNPEAVLEIHLGGGEEFAGFYMDSHSTVTPPEVWGFAGEYAPRFPRLRAITFEFQEGYYDALGPDALVGELRRMHELAATCHTDRLEADAG